MCSPNFLKWVMARFVVLIVLSRVGRMNAIEST